MVVTKLLIDTLKENNTAGKIPPLKLNAEYVTHDQEKAEMLNDSFLSVSSFDDFNVNLPPDMRTLPNESNLSELNLTEQDILDQMKLLDTSKACRPDSLPPMLIKEGEHPMYKLL